MLGLFITSSKWAQALVLISFISVFTMYTLFFPPLPYFYAIKSQFPAVVRCFSLADSPLMGENTILVSLMEL